MWASIGPDILKGLPAAFVALVIGIVAAAIAARQYLLARAKLNLDLFERRYAIYETVWEFLSMKLGPHDDSMETRFANSIPTAYFLFGRDIGEYMDDARKRGHEMRMARIAFQNANDDGARSEHSAKIESLHRGIVQDLGHLRQRFAKYMDFAEWH
jgi:hypothetical protein